MDRHDTLNDGVPQVGTALRGTNALTQRRVILAIGLLGIAGALALLFTAIIGLRASSPESKSPAEGSRPSPTDLGSILPPRIPQSTGASYYVDPETGSDQASGASPGAAWRTLQFAFDHVPFGSVLNLRGGTYAPGSYLRWSRVNPDDELVTTIQSYPGETAFITNRIDVSPFGGSQAVAKGVNLRIRKLKIRNTDTANNGDCIGVHGAVNVEISENEIFECRAQGIAVGSWVARNVQIISNQIYSVGDPASQGLHGIYYGSHHAVDGVIYKNVIHSVKGGWGLLLYTNADNTIVANNRIDDNRMGGIWLGGKAGGFVCENNKILNNVISNHTRNPYSGENWAIQAQGPNSGNVIEGNLHFGNTDGFIGPPGQTGYTLANNRSRER
jgi:Right handed beta helix region